jgi:ABC-type antimicrobial peptide transport system permease subunit
VCTPACRAPDIGAAVLGSAAFLLVAAALISAYGPARRAGRLDTAQLLKSE